MAFLDKLTDIAKNAKSGAEDLVETTKLNSRISEEQKKITRIKQQLGQFIWEQYAAGTEALPQGAVDLCRQIDAANEQIANLNLQINLIKSQANASKAAPTPAAQSEEPAPYGRCFSCGAPLGEGARICSVCGTAVPQQPVEDPVVDVEEMTPTSRICPNCGQEVSAAANFCNVCGTKLN